MRRLLARASRVMVMSRHGRDLLASRYNAGHARIEVIPHGAPDRPFGREEQFKQLLGLEGLNVIMTFGLLGPGKGLEHMIEALPAILERHPNTVYRIVGATHPNLVISDGEAYREGLAALAERLSQEYARVAHDFLERHWQTEQMFGRRYTQVEENLGLDGSRFSLTR